MACSICICSRGYEEKVRCRGGGSRPRRKEGRTWGRRRCAGEALAETLATGVGLRAGGRGRERRIWTEGREARSLGELGGVLCGAGARRKRPAWAAAAAATSWARGRGGEPVRVWLCFFSLQICSDRALNTLNARVFCAKTKRFLRYPLKIGLRVEF